MLLGLPTNLKLVRLDVAAAVGVVAAPELKEDGTDEKGKKYIKIQWLSDFMIADLITHSLKPYYTQPDNLQENCSLRFYSTLRLGSAKRIRNSERA